MEEFLRQYYSILTHGVEIMAALTGLILFEKYKHTAVKYFIYFLVYVVIVELIGSYPSNLKKIEILSDLNEIISNSKFRQNYWWYTTFWSIGGILFFSYYYGKIIKNRTHSRILKYSGSIFLVISIVAIINNIDLFFTSNLIIITSIGLIVILLCVLFYFIEVLNSDKILTFHRSFNFYVTTTILLWWLVNIPLSFYGVYNIKEDMDFVLLKWKIRLFSNIFMYCVFTFALIWSKPQID